MNSYLPSCHFYKLVSYLSFSYFSGIFSSLQVWAWPDSSVLRCARKTVRQENQSKTILRLARGTLPWYQGAAVSLFNFVSRFLSVPVKAVYFFCNVKKNNFSETSKKNSLKKKSEDFLPWIWLFFQAIVCKHFCRIYKRSGIFACSSSPSS